MEKGGEMVGRMGIAVLVLVFFSAHLVLAADAPPLSRSWVRQAPHVRAAVLREVWRQKPEDAFPVIHITGNVLIRAIGYRLEARDIDTGRLLWRDELDDELSVYDEPLFASVGDVLAIGSNWRDDDEANGDLMAVNGRTGAELWESADLLLGSGPGRVVTLTTTHGKAVSAMNPLNGDPVWRSPLPKGCLFGRGAAYGATVALILRCGGATRLRVMRTADGQVLWETPMPFVRFARKLLFVAVTRGLIVAGGSTGGGAVYDSATGRVLTRYSQDLENWDCGCGIAVAPDAIVMTHPDEESGGMRVDVISGATGTIRSWRIESHPQLFLVDGRIYLQDSLPEFKLAGTVKQIVADRGPVVVAALPPQGSTVLGGTAKTLILSAPHGFDSYILLAYRMDPLPAADVGLVARAGVPAARWPDACGLVTSARLDEMFPGGRYTARPHSAPPQLGLSRPNACDLEPAEDGAPPVAVTVLAVSPTVGDARLSMEGARHLALESPRPLSGIGDEAFTWGATPDAVVVRVKTAILRIDVPGHAAAAKTLAREAARILREVA